MADITVQTEIKAGLLPSLHNDLLQIFPLQPPPEARGKYLLAKFAQFVTNELPTYNEHKLDLLKKHAPKDDKNEPILKVTDFGNGQSSITIDPVDRAAFNKEDAELFNVVHKVNLPQLTHADLGKCPIPQGVYTRLLGVLIKDEPPPETI